jgi:hypothetical protein
LMFTAMILACAFDMNGNENCIVFSSGYVSSSLEECVEDLSIGYGFVEEKGWMVRWYECYDWTKKSGSSF